MPATTLPTIRREDPAQPDVVALLADGEAHSAALYPAESNHHLSIAAFREPPVRFLVARDAGGRALATGAVVLHGDWAEIKAMWLVAEARGSGLAARMLDALIAAATVEGAATLRLETGVANHAALALYRRAGFVERRRFADYADDPLSVFMERSADAPQG